MEDSVVYGITRDSYWRNRRLSGIGDGDRPNTQRRQGSLCGTTRMRPDPEDCFFSSEWPGSHVLISLGANSRAPQFGHIAQTFADSAILHQAPKVTVCIGAATLYV